MADFYWAAVTFCEFRLALKTFIRSSQQKVMLVVSPCIWKPTKLSLTKSFTVFNLIWCSREKVVR